MAIFRQALDLKIAAALVPLALGLSFGPAKAATPLPSLTRAPCVSDLLTEHNATCYIYSGLEDRDDPKGRIIKLPVAVIAAPGKVDMSNAVFFLPGGPGSSPLSRREGLANIPSIVADTRDNPLVVFDPRGYVHADPALHCAEYPAASPWFNTLSPVIVSSTDTSERLNIAAEAVRNCFQKLANEGIKVRKYNDYEIARDIDDIRRLLGLEKINLYGVSAGSSTALHYLKHYPQNVRSVIFGWPWIGQLRDRPAMDEFHTQKQLYTDLLSLCAASDPKCRTLLPALFNALDRARRQLDAKPHVREVTTEQGGKKVLYFDGTALLNRLYMSLPTVYDQLPVVLSSVINGDYSRLDGFFGSPDWDKLWDGRPHFEAGAFLALICNDMGSNRPDPDDTVAMLQREPAILGYEDNKMCAWWGSDGDVPSTHHDAVVSDVPALSLHGQLDTCCGVRWGMRIAQTMPNTQIVELRGQGHIEESRCRQKMIASFLQDPHKKVETACRNDTNLRAWQTE